MKIAINGASTMNYPLEDSIPAAGKAGIKGIELWWDTICEFRKTRPLSDIKTLLDEAGLEVIDICPFLVSPFRDTEKLRSTFLDALSVCDEIGCTGLLVCPDYRPMDIEKETALNMHAHEFAWYSEKAKEHGVSLAIEPIGLHTLVGGPDEALELIERVGNPDNLKLIIDTFHYMRSSISYDAMVRIPVEKLFVVHINDSQKGAIEELSDKDRLYPTEGYIDLKKTMDALNEIGYDRYLSVELFNPELWKEPVDMISSRAFSSANKMLTL